MFRYTAFISPLSLAIAAALLSGAVLLSSPEAKASTVVDLTQDNCSGGCNDGVQPFGTVTLTPDGTSVDVAVQLNDNYVFQTSTGLNAFVFSDTSSTAAVTNLSPTPQFSVATGTSFMQDGFKNFTNAIESSSTGGQSLDFTLTNTTLGDFALSTGNGGTHVLFSADIFSPVNGGTTGPVGGGFSPVPLPAALPLFVSGLGALGLFGWRKKRTTKRLAAA